MKLTNKVALITGGTKGIGAAAAIEMAARGADVAIVGRHDDEKARRVKGAIEAHGRRCEILVYDVSIPEKAMASVVECQALLGSVDVLVHSAGGPAGGTALEISPEDWMAAFAIHVHAAYYLCRAVIPAMTAKKEGAIVLVSSVAGIRGCPGALAYGTVKGAVAQFTRMLARDLADDNVRVNAVAPGIVRTAFHANMPEEKKQFNIDNRIPLHREGTPEDIAEAIVMMATNEYMTGEIVVVDGGLTSRIA